MPLDDLAGVIETLQRRIRDHGPTLRENETRTRMALIDPLLTVLGWDVSDPALVTPEYNVSGRKADYALLGTDGRPAATIEAKKLGESLTSHQMQMLNYSNASGVEYAGLTDGNHWELYAVFQRGQIDERRVLEVSIAAMPAHQCALQLLLLWRPNLASGQPSTASAPIYSESPEPEPAPMRAKPTAPALPAATPPPAGWIALLEYNPPDTGPPPNTMRFPDGSEHPVKRWRTLIDGTAAWLCSKGLLTASNVPVSSSNRRYVINTESVHPSGNRFKNSQQISGTPLFVEGNVSRQQARNNAITLLSHCGVNPADVFVEAAP